MSVRAQDLIDKVMNDHARWGALMGSDKMPVTEVMEIILYLRDEGARDKQAEQKIAELTSANAKLNGKLGGQTKAINKLKKALDDQDALKDNNRKLSRIANMACEFVEYAVASEKVGESPGIHLDEEPLFIRLKEECK